MEGAAVYGLGQPPEGTPVLVRGGGSQTLRHVKALCPGRRRGVWGPQPGLALAWPVLVPLPFFSEAVGPEGTSLSPHGLSSLGTRLRPAAGHSGHVVHVGSGHLYVCLPWSGSPLPLPAPACLLQEALLACPALLSLDPLAGRLGPGLVCASASGSGSARFPAGTRWGVVAGRLRCSWGTALSATAECRPLLPQGTQGRAHTQQRREGGRRGVPPKPVSTPTVGSVSRRQVLGRLSPSLPCHAVPQGAWAPGPRRRLWVLAWQPRLSSHVPLAGLRCPPVPAQALL